MVLGHDLKAFSMPRLVRVVLLVPTLSLFVRRFHDVNRSAVWIASLDVIRLCALPPEFLTTPRPLYHHLALRPEPNGFLVGCFSLAVSVAMIVWLLRRGTEGANHYGGGRPVGRKRVPQVAVPAKSVQSDTAQAFGELPPQTVRQGPRKPKVTEKGKIPPENGTRRA